MLVSPRGEADDSYEVLVVETLLVCVLCLRLRKDGRVESWAFYGSPW